MIEAIWDYKKENFDNINGLNTMMERIKTILLLQFGINMENIIIDDSDISKNNLNSIFDKFIEEFEDIYTLFDTFNFYKKDNSIYISQMYKKTIFLTTYITICKLLSEEKELLPIEKLRKNFTYLKDSAGKELFTPNRTTANSQIIFSRIKREIKENRGRRENYYIAANVENYYLYHKILLESQQIPHIKGERKLISQFCPRTILFLVNEFKNIAPENLYKKIYNSKNINQLYKELIKYSKIYDKFILALLSEYNNDISIINELLAIESIMPFNLLTYLLNKLFELKQANVMDDNIEKALLYIVNIPKVFIHINYTGRPNSIDGNYFTVFNSDTILNTILNNGNSTNSNSINWYENYIKSIQIFSEILFPLISKGFFTFIFSIFENREDKIVTAFDSKNNKDNKTITTLKHIKETLEKYLTENKHIIIPPNKTTDKFNRINKKFNEHPDYFDICRKFILNFIVNFTQESLDNYKKIDYNSFSLYKNKNSKACLLDKRIDILTKRIQYYLDNISYDEIDECENNDMIEVIKILFEKYRSIIKNNDNKNKNSNADIIKYYELTEIIKNIVNHHNEKFRKYNLNKKFENKESDNVNNVNLLLKNLILVINAIRSKEAFKFNHQNTINPLIYDRKMNIINQYIDYYIFDINDIKKENTEYLNSIAKTIIEEKIKAKKVKDSKKSENKSIQAVDDTTTTKPKKRKFKKNYSKKNKKIL